LQDLTIREIAVLVPIAVLIFLIGVLPNLFFDKMGASVAALLAQVSRP
jgi:NADH-quinone oxidoreductase subunit M